MAWSRLKWGELLPSTGRRDLGSPNRASAHIRLNATSRQVTLGLLTVTAAVSNAPPRHNQYWIMYHAYRACRDSLLMK